MAIQRSNARVISPERQKLFTQAVKVSGESGRIRAQKEVDEKNNIRAK